MRWAIKYSIFRNAYEIIVLPTKKKKEFIQIIYVKFLTDLLMVMYVISVGKKVVVSFMSEFFMNMLGEPYN